MTRRSPPAIIGRAERRRRAADSGYREAGTTKHINNQADKALIERELKERRRAVLVVNERSRRGKELHAHAKRLLESRGITLDARFSSRSRRDICSGIPEAIEAGHRLIIVGGGDGTLSAAFSHIAETDAVLGVLPCGTANSFARSLDIPVDLDAAIEVIVSGKVVDVDLGRVGDHYFSTVASVGLAAKIARHMPRLLKKYLGRLAYPIVALAQLRRYGAFQCTIVASGEKKVMRALEVRVANAAYQGGVAVAAEADAESRDLVVKVTTGRSIGKLIRVWLRTTAGLSVDPEDVMTIRSDRFLIDASPRQYVSVDGEAFIRTPFEACVAKQALLVMVPRDNHDLS